MTNKKFMKKIAPVVMSAAVVMSSMPYAVMAADFTDSETVTDSAEVISDEFVSDDAQEEFTQILQQQKQNRVRLMSL